MLEITTQHDAIEKKHKLTKWISSLLMLSGGMKFKKIPTKTHAA